MLGAAVAKDMLRENRLRRMAGPQGYTLHKTRGYDPRAIDYGTYRLVGKRAPRGLLRIDEVERFLLGEGDS